MIKIEAKIDDENKIMPQVEKTVQMSEDTLNQIAELVRKGIEENIAQGKEYTGNPVAPLSPMTIRLKGNSRPLVDTGTMLNSIKSKSAGKGMRDVFVANNRAAIAAKLNAGEGKIPPRPFFGISNDVLNKIDKLLKEVKK